MPEPLTRGSEVLVEVMLNGNGDGDELVVKSRWKLRRKMEKSE